MGMVFFGGIAFGGQKVEVLHWWTSGGEAKALQVLKKLLEQEGYEWSDFAVAGGAGSNAMTALKSKVVSGMPPTAAQVLGVAVQEWGEMGFLRDMSAIAQKEGWDQAIYPEIQKIARYQGKYVATPVNIHRTNWLWVNPKVFAKANAKIPTTWPEFMEAAKKIKEAGFIPLAHGGQDWQDATVFETVVLGVGGAEFYQKLFVELEMKPEMMAKLTEIFKVFRELKGQTDPGSPGRDWNLATAMVIKGEAAMQIMGDWAKGEFAAAGKKPGEDYSCVPVPETADKFSFNTDHFIMFQQKDAAKQKAQDALARLIVSEPFQKSFNLTKGSLPINQNVDLEGFDLCGKKSQKAFVKASQKNNLVPSLAHGMAASAAAQGAIMDVITSFFHNPQMSPEAGAQALSQGLQALAH